jgi:hypothetical protein
MPMPPERRAGECCFQARILLDARHAPIALVFGTDARHAARRAIVGRILPVAIDSNGTLRYCRHRRLAIVGGVGGRFVAEVDGLALDVAVRRVR